MSTYIVMEGVHGHLGLYIRQSRDTATRIAGEKPWGGGSHVSSFRSRSDTAAIKRFKAFVKLVRG